jgi:hypothetical protein
MKNTNETNIIPPYSYIFFSYLLLGLFPGQSPLTQYETLETSEEEKRMRGTAPHNDL